MTHSRTGIRNSLDRIKPWFFSYHILWSLVKYKVSPHLVNFKIPVFIEKNLCINGPRQFKLVLFKGQLYTKISHWGFLIFPLKFIYYFLQVLHMPPAPNTTKCVGRPPEPPLQSDPGFILHSSCWLKVNIKTLQFAQIQVSYLGHIIWEQGLYPDPDRLHYALSFLQTQNWVSALRFLKLVDDYQKWIPNFSVMAKPLNNTNPILWEEPDGIVFKVLKESLMNPHALGYPNY